MAIYVVVGARGGTGAQLVARLAEKAPEEVSEIRAVVRDPAKVAAGTFPEDPRVKVMQGDCAKTDTLRSALAGARGVFWAASGKSYQECIDVDRYGVERLAKLAQELGVGRVVLVSAQLVHPANKSNWVRGMLNTVVTGVLHRHGLMDFKFAGEQLLRRSGQEYCIVRPGRLADGPRGRAQVHIGQTNGHFLKGNPTTRADLATVCVAAMTAHGARNTTFEMASDAPVAKDAASIPDVTEEIFNILDAHWDKHWVEGLEGPPSATAAPPARAPAPEPDGAAAAQPAPEPSPSTAVASAEAAVFAVSPPPAAEHAAGALPAATTELPRSG